MIFNNITPTKTSLDECTGKGLGMIECQWVGPPVYMPQRGRVPPTLDPRSADWTYLPTKRGHRLIGSGRLGNCVTKKRGKSRPELGANADV